MDHRVVALPDTRPYLVTRRLILENQESPIHFISGARFSLAK
jgi:hypothetical protein